MANRGWVAGAAALGGLVFAFTVRAEGPALVSPAASASVGPLPPTPPLVPSAAPGAEPPVQNMQPFGGGTEVSVTTPGVHQVSIYVGRAIDLTERPTDYDFVKVGKTPITFQLPPGNYWLEVESPDVTRGSLLLRVDRTPKHVMVHTGSSGMGDLATLTLAVGAAMVLAATVVLASGSTGKTDFDKGKIVIPLYVGGGVLLGSGIGLYFGSRTNVKESESVATSWRSSPGVLVGLTTRF